MPTEVLTIADFSTDVSVFRSFCQWFEACLIKAGWIKTNDPQSDLTTIAKPTAAGDVRGTQFWKPTDALAASAPIVVKVEYGAGSSANNHNLYFTVGSGSDNQGNLTFDRWPTASSTMSRRSMTVSTTNVSGNQIGQVYFTYDEDQCWGLLEWPSEIMDYSGSSVFVIERFRNPDGSASADGLTTFFAGASYSTAVTASAQEGRFYINGGQQPNSPLPHWVTISANQPAAQCQPGTLLGTTLYPAPVFTGVQPRLASPSKFLLALGLFDMQAGMTFNMDHYGVNHKWICAGRGNATEGFSSLNGMTQAVYQSFAMRGD